MRLDLHIHSRYSSDGAMEIKTIIETAYKRGLDGVAICDHNIFAAYGEACELAPPDFLVIPGVEYSTQSGHVLALFVSRFYEHDGPGLRTVEQLRASADADRALLIAAHPFRRREIVPPELFKACDGIEVRNSRDAASAPGNSLKAGNAVTKYSKFAIGGSDAHIVREIAACFTRLPEETEHTLAGVRAALESKLSQGGGAGGKMTDQALSQLRRTHPKTVVKDITRLAAFAVKDVKNKWR